jgi:hypothetical protein
MEMKLIMAHILVTYDIVLVDAGKPMVKWYGDSCLPDEKIALRFRKREE